MTTRSRSILIFLVLGFQTASCATDHHLQLPRVFYDAFPLAVAAGQYKCAHNTWPNSAGDLREFMATTQPEIYSEISERAWEILNHCQFKPTREGNLNIEGKFEPAEPPFPDSERPIELNISMESEACSSLLGDPFQSNRRNSI